MHLESTDCIVKRDTSFNISINGQSRGVAHGIAERDISENRSVDSDDPIKRISEVYVADVTFYHQVPEHGTGNRNIPHKSLSVYVERRAWSLTGVANTKKHDHYTYNPNTVPANTRAFHSAWIATGTSKLPDARYR